MDEISYWDKFMMTGKIQDYLDYVEFSQKKGDVSDDNAERSDIIG